MIELVCHSPGRLFLVVITSCCVSADADLPAQHSGDALNEAAAMAGTGLRCDLAAAELEGEHSEHRYCE